MVPEARSELDGGETVHATAWRCSRPTPGGRLNPSNIRNRLLEGIAVLRRLGTLHGRRGRHFPTDCIARC
jgi:hypothetical protein